MAEGFAAIPTWMIRDTENVSGFAIAVYGVLASRSGYRANFPGQALIASEARCSERKVRDALAELESLGVVERVKRGAKGGGRRTDAYRLMDRPLGADEETIPAPDAGNGGFPAREEGVSGTSEQTIPYIEIDRAGEIEKAVQPAVAPLGFDQWWQAYPLKKDKGVARRAWAKAIKKTDAATLIAAAIQYRNDPNRDEGFTKYPASWLNAEAWENGPLPQRSGAGGGTAVERMVDRMRGGQHNAEGGGHRAIGA